MRQRIEDLGRLSVLLNNLLDHDLFDESNLPMRCKDYDLWWEAKGEEQRDDWLHKTIYEIDNLKDKICEALEIAQGEDRLNQPDL